MRPSARQQVAVVAVAGALALGGAGIAGAQPDSVTARATRTTSAVAPTTTAGGPGETGTPAAAPGPQGLTVCGVLAGRPSADPSAPLLSDGIAALVAPLHLICGHHVPTGTATAATTTAAAATATTLPVGSGTTVAAAAAPSECGPVDEAAGGAGAPVTPLAAVLGALIDLEAQAAALGAPGGVAAQLGSALGCTPEPATEVAPPPAPPAPAPPAAGGVGAPGTRPVAGSPAAPAAGAAAPARPVGSGSAVASAPSGPGTGIAAAAPGGDVPAGAAVIPADPDVVAAVPVVDIRPQAPFDVPAARTALARAASSLLPLLALAASALAGARLTRRDRTGGPALDGTGPTPDALVA